MPVPPQSPNNADLDGQLAQLDRVVSENPLDGIARRDRGKIHAQKGDYERALRDLDRAVLLNPEDARAFNLRGHVWQAKKEPFRAVADYEEAIRLDPAHAEFYRKFRENALQAAQEPNWAAKGLSGFLRQLAGYYAEFLSTDFKKQRLPKRRLQTSDKNKRLVGIPLRKYPGFEQKLWEELGRPIGTGLSLSVPRGLWRSSLSKPMLEAMAAHIAEVNEEALRSAVSDVMARVGRIAKEVGNDPEFAFERFVEETRSTLARKVIAPLLDRMQGFFERTENRPLESLGDLEDQLSSRLAQGIEATAGGAFSAYLVKGDIEGLKAVLGDQISLEVVRADLQDFFSSFAASDLYVDLSDLVRSSRLIDNADFYLHIGEVQHAGVVFPAFYMPISLERTEGGFRLISDPRLYVNKRAMDYVAQEVARAERGVTIPSALSDRIIYLTPKQSPLAVVQKVFDDIVGGFNLRAEIDFLQPREQRVASVFVAVSNRLSLSLFDRSDESMVNDYEAMANGIEAGGEVIEFFGSLIDDFLLHNPVSVREDVDREWDETKMPQRLVFDCPLPLVEEQRKILSAVKHREARFIAVEGPPGTGKSHTITAVAFDLILSGKNLLILSDKKEALDVVEDKLNQCLAKVRPSGDFPNPILRLGKDASNYGKLLSKSTIGKLQVNQRIVRSQRKERQHALDTDRKALTDGLEQTALAYGNIDVLEIAQLESDRASLFREVPKAENVLSDPRLSALVRDFAAVQDFLAGNQALASILKREHGRPSRLGQLNWLCRKLEACNVAPEDLAPLKSLSRDGLAALDRTIEATVDMRMPIFGYLFRGKQIAAAARTLREECGLDIDQPHREIDRLRGLRRYLKDLLLVLENEDAEAEFEPAVAMVAAGLAGRGKGPLAPKSVLDCAGRLQEAVVQSLPLFASGDVPFYRAMLAREDGPFALIDRIAVLMRREIAIADKFAQVPKIDYIGAKSKIESLNTQALAECIDERFIEFYDNKKNDALALAKIIREKQRFPVDKFDDIRRAFPCMIAGLRDYAEYVPLERNLFDLVVIDEASQVSIAQALPAIIRAKKVLVFGDRKQFGNVKTTNASREVNTAYMNDLMVAFQAEFGAVSEAVRTKVDKFDIRSSVLDFIEPVANFAIQLKKHFRSYPEMISFSSKYFYQDNLQVTKIRGIPIDEVIEFDSVDHDGLIEKRNTNVPEAERIVARIEELLDLHPLPSVGVITPHTEQQAYIAKLISEHPQADDIYGRMHLKVMTFDTCQGEEREVIFYSLVATAEKDRLAYVFPRKLDRDDIGEVDHNLRLQRLNVGLSRGEERLVFVHSKALEDYSSSLRTALLHYRNELARAKTMPSANDVDTSSPMEQKVLHWLSQVRLLRELGEDCEIVAQFEIGKYLRQLDPTYQHPDYRVDFLLRVTLDGKLYQLAIEYDGFEFHFDKGVPPALINSMTWRAYLTPGDLEREKVLESFGVQVIRLNRFNLGDDPVATIDALLRERLAGMLNGSGPHDLVAKLAERARQVEEGLRNGKYRRCPKCNRDLPAHMFKDPNTKTGMGRHCRDCKRR